MKKWEYLQTVLGHKIVQDQENFVLIEFLTAQGLLGWELVNLEKDEKRMAHIFIFKRELQDKEEKNTLGKKDDIFEGFGWRR